MMTKQMPEMTKPTCCRCGATGANIRLRRLICTNAISMISWYCKDCQEWAENPPKWIPHIFVDAHLRQYNLTINDIPIFKNHMDVAHACVICGEPAGEYHHWMPQMMSHRDDVLPDWPQWECQGAYLCKRHHDLWHDLVTPWMPGRGNGNGQRPDIPDSSLTDGADG